MEAINLASNNTMNKEFKLLPPRMPNFITISTGEIGKRQDGLYPKQIGVSSLSKTEAEEYGELMKQEFIKHWKKKSK